jgi:hypothetical protein
MSVSEILSAPRSETIPLFTYATVSSRDGKSYFGTIVGQNPFAPGKKKSSIATQIVPIIITTENIVTAVDFTTGEFTTVPGTTTFDPTVADTNCLTTPNDVPLALAQQSPVFQPTDFIFGDTFVGNTQYVDAFQRANFWQLVGNTNYHTMLSPITTLPAIHVDAPSGLAADLASIGLPGCGTFAGLDIDSFDELLVGTVIPSLAALGVDTTTFPIFLLHNVGFQVPPFNLYKGVVLGYHGTNGLQTYSVVDYDSTGLFGPGLTDVSILSHEVGEWMDDPFGTNYTPAWGHVGQQPRCQNNLEVGDPLTATIIPVTMPNGVTYHPQELTFFSWFFGAPSIAVNDWFSNNNTFTSDAGPICQ